MKLRSKDTHEMSVRQAERILEIFENGSRNGKQWAHDVVLDRGKPNYQENIDTLNEAFRLKSIDVVISPLEPDTEQNERQRNSSLKVPPPQPRRKQRGLA